MSLSHLLILAVVALVVVPPDKLPEFARQIARLLGDIRRSTSGIWDDLKHEALLKPEDLLKHHANKSKTEIKTELPAASEIKEEAKSEKKDS